MKLFAVIILFWCIISCKPNEIKDVPSELVGKWRLTSQQLTVNGASQWKDIESTDSLFLYFSRYGELVDARGYLMHCGPTSLNINGRVLKIEFHADQLDIPIPVCIECSTWNMDLQQTHLVIERCSSDRKMRFVKEV